MPIPQRKLSEAMSRAEEKKLGEFLTASTRETVSPQDAENQLLASLALAIRRKKLQT